MSGGAGNDLLIGGDSRDIFAAKAVSETGHDVVMNFGTGDLVRIEKEGASINVSSLVTQVGSNAVVSYGPSSSMVLSGINTTMLTVTSDATYYYVSMNPTPPVANHDVAATAEGDPVVINVLANDEDVNVGDVISVVSADVEAFGVVNGVNINSHVSEGGYLGNGIDLSSIALGAGDFSYLTSSSFWSTKIIDDGAGNYSINLGAHTIVNADGSITFDPGYKYIALQAGDSVVETVTYTIVDATGATASANISVTITGEGSTWLSGSTPDMPPLTADNDLYLVPPQNTGDGDDVLIVSPSGNYAAGAGNDLIIGTDHPMLNQPFFPMSMSGGAGDDTFILRNGFDTLHFNPYSEHGHDLVVNMQSPASFGDRLVIHKEGHELMLDVSTVGSAALIDFRGGEGNPDSTITITGVSANDLVITSDEDNYYVEIAVLGVSPEI